MVKAKEKRIFGGKLFYLISTHQTKKVANDAAGYHRSKRFGGNARVVKVPSGYAVYGRR